MLKHDLYETFCKHCPQTTHCCKFTQGRSFCAITKAEIKNISRFKRTLPSEFVDASTLSPLLRSALEHADPLSEGGLHVAHIKKSKIILRLKTKKVGKETHCIFLDKDGKCSIYPVRPAICQMYPFWVVKLLNGKYRIIFHDALPKCLIAKYMKKTHLDIDTYLTTAQKNHLIQLFLRMSKK